MHANPVYRRRRSGVVRRHVDSLRGRRRRGRSGFQRCLLDRRLRRYAARYRRHKRSVRLHAGSVLRLPDGLRHLPHARAPIRATSPAFRRQPSYLRQRSQTRAPEGGKHGDWRAALPLSNARPVEVYTGNTIFARAIDRAEAGNSKSRMAASISSIAMEKLPSSPSQEILPRARANVAFGAERAH
jgi:hypothetical protein